MSVQPHSVTGSRAMKPPLTKEAADTETVPGAERTQVLAGGTAKPL